MTIEVRGNLGKTILQLAAQFSDGPSAIWEYVSNSLEYRAKADGCKINVQIEKKRITISDNSDGMNNQVLENFFTISGENLARKGIQKSWMKRGIFGTGKTAKRMPVFTLTTRKPCIHTFHESFKLDQSSGQNHSTRLFS